MVVAKTLLVLLLCAQVADSKYWRCKTNVHCRYGECCARNRCKPLLQMGNRCNVLRQITSQQCPCTPGTTCRETMRKRVTFRTRMICKPIFRFDHDDEEMVEYVINI